MFRKNWLIPIIFCLLTTAVALKPLLNPNLISGHDVGSHILKAQLFFNALKENQFPVRWVENQALGINLPHFEFYPPLFYYLTSLPQFAGSDSVTATYLVLILATLISWWGMYCFVRSFSSLPAALAAATIFTLSPYRFSQLYVRATYTEYLATAFIPWIFLAVKRQHFNQIALFSSLILLSHQPTLFIIAFPLLIWAIITINRESWPFNHKSYLLNLKSILSSVLLFLGLTAFFTLPLIFERQFINWPLLNSNYYDFHLHFATLKQLLHSKWDFGLSQVGPNDTMSFQLGIINWLILLTSITYTIQNRSKPISRYLFLVSCFLLLVTFFALFMSTAISLPVWERFSFLSFIQYPWRFLSLATFSTAALVPTLFSFISHYKPTTQLTAAGLFAFLLLILNLNYIKPSVFLARNTFDLTNLSSPSFTQTSDPFFGLEKGYFPIYTKAFSTARPTSSLSLLQGQAQFNLTRNTATQKIAHVQATSATIIRFFVHYFPGWTATIQTGSELPRLLSLNFDNPEGFIDLSLPPGNSTVKLELKRTPVREIADFISLVSLLAFIALTLPSCLRQLSFLRHLKRSLR